MGRLISASPRSDNRVINFLYQTLFKNKNQIFYKYWSELGENIVDLVEPFEVEIVSRGEDVGLERDLLIIRKHDYQTISENIELLLDNFRMFQPLNMDFRGLIPKEIFSQYLVKESKLRLFFKELLERKPIKFTHRETMMYSEEFEYAKGCFDSSLFDDPTAHTKELLARLDLIISLLVLRPVGLIWSDIYL